MRHHIAGIELVGPLGCFPIGPVVRLMQEDAELALHRHPGDQMMPYERLLGDAIEGDASLSVEP